MNEMNWFDNATGTYFHIGDAVIWQGDDEMTGILTAYSDTSFTITWEDGNEIIYSHLDQDAIQKH